MLKLTQHMVRVKEAENKIRELNAEIGNSCCIYRLPDVFGKWSRPNYNSVVALLL